MTQSQTSAMLFGALVADAASLGLHWLYDPDHIAKIAAQRGSAAFAPVDADYFEGATGYFAHGSRHAGMLSQYGEALWLAIRSMSKNGNAFDAPYHRAEFAAHFGAGGAYHGYIDRPTRGALDNITADRAPSGIDDDQNPAVSCLPAIVAVYRDAADLSDKVTEAMQITNVNDVASVYGTVFTHLLCRILDGTPLTEALETSAQAAQGAVREALGDALETNEPDSTIYAGHVGRACHLPTSGPVMFHVLRHSASYSDAVERNILAGGDSAGRSIVIGAAMAAAHGIATPNGLPLAWALQVENGVAIWEGCQRLSPA